MSVVFYHQYSVLLGYSLVLSVDGTSTNINYNKYIHNILLIS